MRLTKKELNNLYARYSNGEFARNLDTSFLQATGAYYYVDEDLFHKTMDKIFKIKKRKPYKKVKK